MAARILITIDDLETTVPLNAALVTAGYTTAMLSSMARRANAAQRPPLQLIRGL